MAEYISKICTPNGTTYEVKDSSAWKAINDINVFAGIKFVICYTSGTPDVSKIPEGTTVTYNRKKYTGTLSVDDAELSTFYLVKSTSSSSSADSLDDYREYVVVVNSDDNTRSWECIGYTVSFGLFG